MNAKRTIRQPMGENVPGPVPYGNAVMLQVRIEGRWRTVRLLDNAHGEHEMHRYTGSEKQAAERFAHGSVREVAPQAIDYLESSWEEIARAWRS